MVILIDLRLGLESFFASYCLAGGLYKRCGWHAKAEPVNSGFSPVSYWESNGG